MPKRSKAMKREGEGDFAEITFCDGLSESAICGIYYESINNALGQLLIRALDAGRDSVDAEQRASTPHIIMLSQ